MPFKNTKLYYLCIKQYDTETAANLICKALVGSISVDVHFPTSHLGRDYFIFLETIFLRAFKVLRAILVYLEFQIALEEKSEITGLSNLVNVIAIGIINKTTFYVIIIYIIFMLYII